MKKLLMFLLIAALVFSATACKSGKDRIAENDNLARILGNGAAGAGGKGRGFASETPVPPNVDDANARSTTLEGVDYTKLIEGISTGLDAGTYTVGMADNACTISVRDAEGKEVQSVTIGSQGDKGTTGLKPAAAIEVPEGGSAMSTGGTCIAQKR